MCVRVVRMNIVKITPSGVASDEAFDDMMPSPFQCHCVKLFLSDNTFELGCVWIGVLFYHSLFHHIFLFICTPGIMFVGWYVIYSISMASLFRVYDTTEIALGNLIADIWVLYPDIALYRLLGGRNFLVAAVVDSDIECKFSKRSERLMCLLVRFNTWDRHYIDVIMNTMTTQITSLTVVYSIFYSGADQRKHQSSASLAFVQGIHRDRWIPLTKSQ